MLDHLGLKFFPKEYLPFICKTLSKKDKLFLLNLQLFTALLLILVYGGISGLFGECTVCIFMGPISDNAVLKDDIRF